MFRQVIVKLIGIWIVSIGAANAATAPVKNLKQESGVVAQPSAQLTVKSSILTAVDNDAKQLQEIQRKQAIKDALNKYNSVDAQDKNSLMGQTTATNIIINEDGYKSATLQFIDGSTLDVEPGSRIGKFMVDKIAMTGVTLHEVDCKKKCASKLVKRAYPKRPANANTAIVGSYQSTPVVTEAVDNNMAVPPIINTK